MRDVLHGRGRSRRGDVRRLSRIDPVGDSRDEPFADATSRCDASSRRDDPFDQPVNSKEFERFARYARDLTPTARRMSSTGACAPVDSSYDAYTVFVPRNTNVPPC